jgi:plasmid stabilization system protein ParE
MRLLKLRYSRRAQNDLASIYSYLAERSPSGAINVMTAIYATIAFIRRRPDAAPNASTSLPSPLAGKAEKGALRVKIVQKYDFKIFYRAVDGSGTIEIVHIRHMAQRPWSGQ